MSSPERARTYFDNAFNFVQSGKLAEAVNSLSMAITFDSRPLYYFHRCHLYLEMKDLDSARVDLAKAEQLFSQMGDEELLAEDFLQMQDNIRSLTPGASNAQSRMQDYATKRMIEPLLSELRLDPHIAKIKELMRPSVRLKPTGGTAPTGASKLGGFPDVPPNFQWPVSNQNVPLAVIGQMNLEQVSAKLPSSGIPSHGLLYFFFDAQAADAGQPAAYRILYAQDMDNLSTVHAPASTPQDNTFFEAAVVLYEEDSYPDWDHPLLRAFLPPQAEANYRQFLHLWYGPAPHHRLMGYAHGAVCPENQAGGFRSLLQVDSDPDCCMKWGTGGLLYFMLADKQPLSIQPNDVRVILQ